MPPQISDDESEGSGGFAEPIADPTSDKKGKSKSASVDQEEPEQLQVESGDEDEEIGEDEYVVEKITNHLVDEESGELKYEVKWEGFHKKSDRTWEPEANLFETASEILNAYLEKVGGKEKIMADYQEKKALAAAKKGKKRGRAPSGTDNTNGTKRGKKHPRNSTPPLSAKQVKFKPPTGSWEEEVVAIDACEGTEGNVVVYLTWKGGHKSQHPLAQIYKRCPQKMLKFYEDHLVFKKSDGE